MRDTRLYMLDTGSVRLKVHNIKMNQGDGADYEVPVPFYVLTHPKGIVVIDGGIAVECAQNAQEYWGAASTVFRPVMTEAQGCVARLGEIGIAPEDVTHVVQSHLHLDHSGAVGRFPNARHLVQRKELEYAYAPDWFSVAAYIRKDIDRRGVDWDFLDGEVTDGADLFGDGTLRMFFTPGHAPGNQSFLVTLPRSGPILLTVDAAYTLDHWNEKALPGYATSALDAVRSVKKLHRLAGQTQARVVTGHDPDDWKNFKHGPEYYD